MTGRGEHQSGWTTSELRYLVEHAGQVPVRELCRRLGKSYKAVESQASRMRRQGLDVDLRYYEPKLSICPACGCARSTLNRRHSTCIVCRRRVQLAAIHARISRLLRELPPEERQRYAENESKTGSRQDPRPKMPNLEGLRPYWRQKVQEDHDRAMEAWQSEYLKRQIKAAQKRKERIQQKVKRFKKFSK